MKMKYDPFELRILRLQQRKLRRMEEIKHQLLALEMEERRLDNQINFLEMAITPLVSMRQME